MPDPSRRDWDKKLDARLAALGVPPTRRVDILAEVEQHLADAHRAALTDEETDRLIRGVARVERRVTLEPPILGK